ncbi:hydrogenase formation protein HypD [Ignisphaera sp. 4213-co]|uniref:Hydrogenase formation protein HypD n=2 Tax=Ignisphaera cupida TaxID=3050454 RepID=A0ABD4Z9G9_9CREN|nr:hydrogenase formation protein HypD [Ignisphaera sp. 4213-co]MDK6028733.1 hydrogenase formation protein HypD [Ignisphaera sp. 4213-co]
MVSEMQNSEHSELSNFLKVVNKIESAFRENRELVSIILKKIMEYSKKLEEAYGKEFKFKIMNFCGTHEWTITHFGIRSLVPKNIELVAGPGCPVCVTPSYFIEEAIKLALDGFTIYTYGDTYRLRTVNSVRGYNSLSDVRSDGDVKIVTSFAEAIADARRSGRESVFIGIGFETVAPGYASAIIRGIVPENLKIMSLVKLTPPAMFYTLEILREKPTEPPVMGVIAPGHVSTITGAKAWAVVSENYGIPVVISGFEPIDVLLSILEILKQLVKGEAKTVIEYKRAVTWHGDVRAQRIVAKAFRVVDDAWRGIGFLPESGLRLREEYRKIDAFAEIGVEDLKPDKWVYDLPPGCRCAEVTLGKAKPTDCPLFMRICTPSKPYGPCMVSLEGACAIWARFGSGGLADEIAKDLGLQ